MSTGRAGRNNFTAAGGVLGKGKIWLNGLLLALVLLLGDHFLVTNMAVVKLEVTTDNRTLFRIYYKDADSNWTAGKVASVSIKPGRTSYNFRLADISKVSDLRIDTSEKPATVTVHSIDVLQYGYQPLQINSKDEFEKLRPGEGIADFTIGDNGFTVTPSTHDPQLLLTLGELRKTDTRRQDMFRVGAIVLLSLVLVFHLQAYFNRYQFVCAMALVVFSLIVVMAGISRYNVHPDEGVHVQAAKYYQQHNLPPRVGDSDILHTYSKYGVSRLHSAEIAYFVAGKFAWLLQPLQLPSYLALRFFNVSLFGILVLLAVKHVPYRLLLIPLLLSPQVWYIFSYFNSEAFGLFIILLTSYQVVETDSAWNRLLEGRISAEKAVVAVLGLSLLFGLLLLLKMNFYFYGLFLFCYFAWRLFFGSSTFSMQAVVIVCTVIIAGGAIFGTVRWVDSAVNEHAKKERLVEARELYAEKMFKPSTPLEKKFAYLQMKDRGVSLRTVLQHGRWGEKSFRSSFGEYGYMTVAASYRYYDIVRYAGLALLLVASAFIVIQGGWEGRSLLVISLGCSLLLMGTALYHSWSVDFQAQGRYFLPIVGMLSVLTYHMRHPLGNMYSLLLVGGMYALSVYSFVFVALAGIGKYSYALG